MNSEAVFWMKRVKGCTIVEKSILQMLTFDAGNTRLPGELPKAFTAIGTMTRIFDCDRRHIERAIDGLCEKGFVSKKSQIYGRSQSTNFYFFHVDRFFPVDTTEKKLVGKKTGKVTSKPARRWNAAGKKVLHTILTCLKESTSDQTLIDGLTQGGLDPDKRIFWLVMPSQAHETAFYRYFETITKWLRKFHGDPLFVAHPKDLPNLPFRIELIRLYNSYRDR